MRARKRNPWWGEGLDKRQARRARRRGRRPIRGQRVTTYYFDEVHDFTAAQVDAIRAAMPAIPADMAPVPAPDPSPQIVYTFDPRPEPPAPEPGVTPAYFYQWSGSPGPARYIEGALLVDPDGGATLHFEPDAEWRDCTVVDETQEKP